MTDDFPDNYWAKVDEAWRKNETQEELVNLRKRDLFRLAPILFPTLASRQRRERDGD